MQNTSFDTKRLVGLALLAAIVVVLQLAGGFVSIGSVSISLVLVPVVVGAAMYGAAGGAGLGLVFGIVVLINAVNGVDVSANMLWVANPIATAAVCLLKGTAAGLVAGLVCGAVSKKVTLLGVVCAAVVCPMVNTGIFITAMLVFFKDTLVLWAGGTHFLIFAFAGLVGVNFLIELAVNIILSPGIIRIIGAVKKV